MKIQWFVLLLGIMLCAASSCKSKQKLLKADVAKEIAPEAETDEVMTFNVDEMAVFPDCTPQEWLCKNVKYPREAMDKGIQGKVYVQFIIDKQGNVTELEVLRGSGSHLLDQAAIEVVSRMPMWKPAKHQGKRVRVYYTMPINFELSR